MDNRIIMISVRIILAVVLSFGSASGIIAQEYVNTPVSISKEKVRINGKVCYSHVVLERQTLFSISKAYNVSIDDIHRFNPTLKETGLIKNSIIIIPSSEAVETVNEVREDIQENSREKIAETEKTVEIRKTVEPKKARKKTHTVKWYENLDEIAAKYGVTAEEIMLANNLSGKKLKSRMKLTIPEPGEYLADAQVEEKPQPNDTVTVEIQKEPVEEREKILPQWWPGNRKDHIKASLLLPLKADGKSSSRTNMDFYSGVLLAVNDLAQSGIGTDLNVRDIAGADMAAARRSTSFSDVVIGPVSVRDLTGYFGSDFNSVMTVSPLDPKADSMVPAHAQMIQAPTPHKVQYTDLAAWINEDLQNGDKVLVITEKGARPTEAVTEMKQAVDSSNIRYESFSYSILEGRDVINPLKGLMTATAVNRVLIASESEAFVNDVVRNLNVMIHQKYNVVLYGGSKIRSFETIEAENFHKTNLHVSLTYYIDYNDHRVKNFLLKYRALFNTEPTQFAFQGYDIASYFIEMCAKYGNDWKEMLTDEEKSMLQSTFRFVKEGEGGYINHGVRRIVYEPDWTISKIR